MVVFSWGACNFQALHNGLRFKVNGFKHKGWVRVFYNDGNDDFTVELINDKNESLKSIGGVYFDCLVEVIDSAVERVSDYENTVKEWLKSNDY